jgi:hypothetical protein
MHSITNERKLSPAQSSGAQVDRPASQFTQLAGLKDKMAEERDELVESPMEVAQPGGGTEGRVPVTWASGPVDYEKRVR